MGYQNTIDILLNDVEDLKELLLHVREKEHMSAIEIDLAKDKLRQVYDIFRMLETPEANNQQTVENEKIKEDKPLVKPDEKETKDQANKKPQETTGEQPPKTENPVRTEDFKVKSTTENQPPLTEEEMTMTLGDKYKSLSDSLNDHMGKSKKNSDLASKYQTKPIKNIHTAIGLNEKFQLIKELFKGDSDLYNQTINELNNASNFNEAYMYLNENFNWDMDDRLVKRILELTRRKFISANDE